MAPGTAPQHPRRRGTATQDQIGTFFVCNEPEETVSMWELLSDGQRRLHRFGADLVAHGTGEDTLLTWVLAHATILQSAHNHGWHPGARHAVLWDADTKYVTAGYSRGPEDCWLLVVTSSKAVDPRVCPAWGWATTPDLAAPLCASGFAAHDV